MEQRVALSQREVVADEIIGRDGMAVCIVGAIKKAGDRLCEHDDVSRMLQRLG